MKKLFKSKPSKFIFIYLSGPCRINERLEPKFLTCLTALSEHKLGVSKVPIED